jgi:hypothetical protein
MKHQSPLYPHSPFISTEKCVYSYSPTSHSSSLKMETVCASKTSVTSPTTTRCKNLGTELTSIISLKLIIPSSIKVYGSIALCWTLATFSVSWSFYSQWDSLEDQAVASQLPTCRTAQTQNKRAQTSMSQVAFEPTITVSERAKRVHALDRAATLIGCLKYLLC